MTDYANEFLDEVRATVGESEDASIHVSWREKRRQKPPMRLLQPITRMAMDDQMSMHMLMVTMLL
eukprot:CAMPEP_0172331566 /NCGR_PEP_ID=MMETSP1058-20130122/61995_1 /TAXON_ID=83371 /ORGANISM="Detonula confervacea, Strain CCMP 353" /LENGTH=64 /DNA_ID=CAMNT_0013048835 /DNA_START=782 /DNA_END=973 /DNA_ORIENTATION=+